MNIGFVSLGCSKNLVDSENIMGLIKAQGYSIVSDPSIADYLFVNTCGFINSAKEESISTILEMAQYKEDRCKKLFVLGCLAQRYKEQLVSELPEVDRFITIDEYPHLPTILRREMNKEFISCDYKRVISTKPWTAYLKIAEGCSNRCSFCAIPLIRHDYRSFDFDEIIAEAHFLQTVGVKEVNIIAQDTTRYGIELYGKSRLLDILEELNKMDFKWIRVLYMYPDEITEDLIIGMSKLDRVLPYFDIPVQYGNDRMLKLMNRRGSIEHIKDMISLIKRVYDKPTLRTTMIVGFPQETEEDFNDLIEFVKDVRWDRLGAFAYSIEEDTKAYDMEPKVSEDVAQSRLKTLMDIQEKIAHENSMNLVGEVMEVLIESVDGLTNMYRGRSRFSAPDGIDGIVSFKSNNAYKLGEFVKVRIIDANNHDLIAQEV